MIISLAYYLPNIPTMKTPFERILIFDDDYLHNSLAIFSIRRLLQCIHLDITVFTDAYDGIRFIETEYVCKPVKTILFLDIYMAHLSDWKVVESIEAMPGSIQNYFSIYILANVINKNDLDKARSIPLVKNYFMKPLSNHFPELFGEIVLSMLPTL